MKGVRRGFIYMLILYALTLASYALYEYGFIKKFSYEFIEIRQMLSSLLALSMLVYFYEKVRWENETKIKEDEKEIYIKNIFDKQFQDAGEIQRTFIPEKNFISDYIDVVGYYKPAMEIGGDYFDFFYLDDDRMGVIICDVSSKGIPAALIMVKLRTIVKIYSDLKVLKPHELLTAINKILVNELMSHMFITSIYLTLNNKTGKLEFSNAGHEPMMYYSTQNNTVTAIDDAGLPLGIASDENMYQNCELSLNKDDIILLYTDGITDMGNKLRELYGHDRLKKFLQESSNLSAREISENLIEEVVRFSEGKNQADDIALVVMKMK
jgi:sigma-B regulation protein RsbU (phosphoserine phosphatase)